MSKDPKISEDDDRNVEDFAGDTAQDNCRQTDDQGRSASKSRFSQEKPEWIAESEPNGAKKSSEDQQAHSARNNELIGFLPREEHIDKRPEEQPASGNVEEGKRKANCIEGTRAC